VVASLFVACALASDLTARVASAEGESAEPPPDMTDLVVTVSGASMVRVSDEFTHTITVVNRGWSNASGVTVIGWVSGKATSTAVRSSQGECFLAGSNLSCRLGDLAVGRGATITLAIRPVGEGSMASEARAAADQADANTANNSAVATTSVVVRTPGSCVHLPMIPRLSLGSPAADGETASLRLASPASPAVQCTPV
jgi:hypothetical protein